MEPTQHLNEDFTTFEYSDGPLSDKPTRFEQEVLKLLSGFPNVAEYATLLKLHARELLCGGKFKNAFNLLAHSHGIRFRQMWSGVCLEKNFRVWKNNESAGRVTEVSV